MITFFARRRIEREWAVQRHARFVTYAHARRMVVLADAADVPVLQEYAAQWAAEGRHVTWVIFTITMPKVANPLPGDTLYICRRAGGLFALPSRRELAQFDAMEADVLIDLSPRRCAAMQFLAAHSRVPMKIGVVDTLRRRVDYDLAIRRNDSPGVVLLLQEMLLYWGKVAGGEDGEAE